MISDESEIRRQTRGAAVSDFLRQLLRAWPADIAFVIPLERSDTASIALVAERFADVMAVGVTQGHALMTDTQSQVPNIDNWSRGQTGVVLTARA